MMLFVVRILLTGDEDSFCVKRVRLGLFDSRRVAFHSSSFTAFKSRSRAHASKHDMVCSDIL
jgi:hypothetical protein